MFNYCPRCGKQVTNSENQPFHCVHCDFTHYQNTATAVAAIIVADNQLLLAKRAKNPGMGKWDLPGGFVDPNESQEAALQRELQEELGIDVPHSAMHYLCSHPNIYCYKNVSYHTCDAVFVIELAKPPPIHREDSEIAHVQWFSVPALPLQDFAFASIKSAAELFLRRQSSGE